LFLIFEGIKLQSSSLGERNKFKMEWKNYSKHISAHVERVEVSVEK
jgi:hypothetical protein